MKNKIIAGIIVLIAITGSIWAGIQMFSENSTGVGTDATSHSLEASVPQKPASEGAQQEGLTQESSGNRKVGEEEFAGMSSVFQEEQQDIEEASNREQEQREKQPEEGEIAVLFLVEGVRYQASIPEESTIYDLMKLLQENQGLQFGGREYTGIGFFIDEINGKKQSNKEKMYWILYINGKKATVGVSQYVLSNNDAIEWKYEPAI